MTLDLGIWPLTSLTYKGTPKPIASLTQVWFQMDFNFSKETRITKTNIFQLDLRRPLTLVHDLLPC